jgi:hypothetical protein
VDAAAAATSEQQVVVQRPRLIRGCLGAKLRGSALSVHKSGIESERRFTSHAELAGIRVRRIDEKVAL